SGARYSHGHRRAARGQSAGVARAHGGGPGAGAAGRAGFREPRARPGDCGARHHPPPRRGFSGALRWPHRRRGRRGDRQDGARPGLIAVWFRRFMYRQFVLASRTQDALARRLTTAGKLVAGALVAAMIFGPHTRLTVSYHAFTLAALLTVAALSSIRAPRALDVRRRLPRFATVGEPVTYHVIVRNPGDAPRAGLSLLENLDDPRPDLQAFASAREPDEPRRNWFD